MQAVGKTESLYFIQLPAQSKARFKRYFLREAVILAVNPERSIETIREFVLALRKTLCQGIGILDVALQDEAVQDECPTLDL